MDKKQAAVQYFDSGFSCAQSVLAAFAPDYGLNEETALRLATGFGSGMGRMCEICGALTGAYMVLGLKYGKVITDGSKYGSDTETTYRLVRELTHKFEERNGSKFCRDLVGHDLSIPEEREKVIQLGLFKTTCRKCVIDSVELLEEML